MRKICILLSALVCHAVFAQPVPTSAEERARGLDRVQSMELNSLVKNVSFRNVGPNIMSGRVTDLEVNPADPTKFYVAYASGGLWYTENNGQSFVPLFDHEEVMTIGDIAVDWAHNIIWIGTGEVNSSRSSYAGNGVYKSADAGKSWIYCGLPESHHIGKIAVNPKDPDMVFVAALGHLYSPNPDRGVYKTTDGGQTWNKVLYVNDTTGAVDLMIDPNVPDIMYACMWQRDRRAWNFSGTGRGSGIYKSTDAGESWSILSDSASMFPIGNKVGRIGIGVSYQHNNVVYAVVDDQFPRPDAQQQTEPDAITVETFKDITKEQFLALDNDKLNAFLQQNYIPKEFTAEVLKQKILDSTYSASVLSDYLDAGDYVFDLPIRGCEVYKSMNSGVTWEKTHDMYLDDMYYTYGYYFGKIFVSPVNENKIIITGVQILMSEDGGKTWKSIDAPNTHGDHHVVWMDPKNDKHIIIGNDGGVNITYDNGAHWFKANNPPVGQFYSIEVDDAEPYNVYGGLQDNGVWGGPSNYVANDSWMQDGAYPYALLYWGDGMQVRADRRDNNMIYTGFQYGYYARVNRSTRQEEISIRPRHSMGEKPLRFNWETPIWLSRHNSDVLYYGSNRFHRSLKQGAEMETLSGDLTNGKKKGDVPYATLTCIYESPLRFGMLYCGTDDGNIWISKDGGYNWNKINVFIKKETAPAKGKTPAQIVNAIPSGLWVSQVTASKFSVDRVYATLNGYRYDDFTPYVFVSDDQGGTWKRIGNDLPYEPVNVIAEDPVNENILYVGTDNGLYVSLNRGVSFMAFNGGLPRVAVHDIAIQERENDIVIGTHGRSIYIASLDELQQLTPDIMGKELAPLHVPDLTYDAGRGYTGSPYAPEAVSEEQFPYYSKGDAQVHVEVRDENDHVLHTGTIRAGKGINYYAYDLAIDASATEDWKNAHPDAEKGPDERYYLLPGNYTIAYTTESMLVVSQPFTLIQAEQGYRGGGSPEPEEAGK
ncbi:MAG: hypothetical protein R2794_11505 [Chitinophagales bacterium]